MWYFSFGKIKAKYGFEAFKKNIMSYTTNTTPF